MPDYEVEVYLESPEAEVAYAGPQGLKGDTGAKGDKGDQGLQGDKGNTGDTGLTGAQGLKGDTGLTGPQGIQGIQGIQGVKGDPGDLTSADSTATTPWNGSFSIGYTGPRTVTRTLGSNSTITAISAGPTGQSYTATLIIKQAASGGPFTLAWPSTLEWSNDAAAPQMPTVANSELIVSLFWTGIAWRAVLVGVYYP